VEDWLDQLKENCEAMGGKKLANICQDYLDSEEMELEDVDLVTLLGWILKTIRTLPDSFNVLEFTGPVRMIQICVEEFWSELKVRAVNEKLYDLLGSFGALLSL
jgi:hypothetical protein